MTNPELLEARYGRRKSRTRDRRIGIASGGILGVLLVVGIFWAAFGAPPKAEGNISGIEITDATLATVKGVVTKPIDRTAVCGIAARNGNFSIIGYVEITFAEKERSVPFAVTMKTTELAASGAVTECRLK